ALVQHGRRGRGTPPVAAELGAHRHRSADRRQRARDGRRMNDNADAAEHSARDANEREMRLTAEWVVLCLGRRIATAIFPTPSFGLDQVWECADRVLARR